MLTDQGGFMLAHQGGWDEMLIVAAILFTFWWMIKRQHTKAAQPQHNAETARQLAQDSALELSQDDSDKN